MKEYLAFLKEKDDKMNGSVATGNRSGKLIVKVSPIPMEVDEKSEKSQVSSSSSTKYESKRESKTPTQNGNS